MARAWPALSGCVSIDGVDDSAEFDQMERAMGTLNIGAAQQGEIFDVVAAVLHLGTAGG